MGAADIEEIPIRKSPNIDNARYHILHGANISKVVVNDEPDKVRKNEQKKITASKLIFSVGIQFLIFP